MSRLLKVGVLVVLCCFLLSGCIAVFAAFWDDTHGTAFLRVQNRADFNWYGIRMGDAEFLDISAFSTTGYQETEVGDYYVEVLTDVGSWVYFADDPTSHWLYDKRSYTLILDLSYGLSSYNLVED